MSEYVLIPGAGGAAWYWHLVVAELADRGHEAVAVELPCDDNSKGLPDYAAAVLRAAGDRRSVVVVAASLGAFTAPLVAEPLRARAIVLVNAMIPLPGETAGEWWTNTASLPARVAAAQRHGYPTEFDPSTYFLHDVPPEVIAQGEGEQKPQSDAVFVDPCAFETWPAPVTVIAGRDDRFFPVEFQQKLAQDRLGVQAIIVPGGHLAALSHPRDLTTAILSAT